jgi:serine/threonine-protein kinase
MQPGSIIGGRFQLVDKIASGGLSEVWQGVARGSEVFARPVAVKVMKREFSMVGGPYLQMFLEEARIGAALQHSNVIQVLDFIVEASISGPVYCLVMEWIDGVDLKTMLQTEKDMTRPLSAGLVATIALRVLRGLAAAHERRTPDNKISPVIHRDVSPQNILLALNGDVKLADFGMARARDRIAEHTAPGFVKGNLSYIAPEILSGQPASPISDLFSFGVTLWESLTQDRLFFAKKDMEIYELIRKCEVPPLIERRKDLPPPMVDAIHRALSPDPAKRFKSAREMGAVFGEILRVEPWGDADVIIGDAVAQTRAAQLASPM